MCKDSIKRFFSLPTPNAYDDSAFVAWLINTIAVGLIITSVVFITPIILVQPGLVVRYLVLTFLVVPACGVVLLISRSGKTRIAAMALVGFLWLLITISVFLTIGIQSPIFMGYFIVVLLGGLLIGPWTGLVLAIASIMSGGLAVWVVEQGYLIPYINYSLTSRLAIWAFFLTILAILQSLASLTTRSALGRARQELAQRHETDTRQHALLDAIPELVFRIRRDGVFVDYHAPIKGQLHSAPDQFLGKPIQAVMPPDVVAMTFQAIERVQQTGQATDFEYSLQMQGQVQYYEARMVASGDDEVLVTVRDISERKQSERHLRQRLNELAAMHAVSQAAASQLELKVLFDLIAQELIRLFDIQEIYFALIDQQTAMVQFPYYWHDGQQLETSPVPLGQGLSSQVILSRQPILINQNYDLRSAELGVVRFTPAPVILNRVSWLGVPIPAGEQVIGVICVQNLKHEHAFTDADVRLMTTIAMNVGIAIQNAQLFTAVQQELVERKQAEQEREQLIEELEARNAELERFIYTVSHELKAPLVTIRGFLGFVEMNAQMGNLDRLRDDMQRIVDATDRMQRLLGELLELSRIGRLMNPPQMVSFDVIVREALELVRGQLRAVGIRVILADNLPVVYGDPTRLVEVVQNLLDNACKFMGSQPEPLIEIGQRGLHADGKPILFVRDNGIGIEAPYHHRVFGLFNKLDPQTDGTGVGLALVRRILEYHHGKIWVESEGAGRGTTFCFTLPIAGENLEAM